MKAIAGLALIIIGILVGLYVGVWLCFIGGIVQVINEIRAANLDAMNIAIGIAKVFLSGLAGWLSAIICILPGAALLKD